MRLAVAADIALMVEGVPAADDIGVHRRIAKRDSAYSQALYEPRVGRFLSPRRVFR